MSLISIHQPLTVPPASGFNAGIVTAAMSQSWRTYPNAVIPGVERSQNPAGYDFAVSSGPELQYYLDKGCRLFRQDFFWDRMQRPLMGPLDATYLAFLDSMVNYVTSRGARVALECHNYLLYFCGGNTGTFPGPDTGAGVLVTPAQLADLWGKIAAHYAGNPLVMYDLMNEPHIDGLAAYYQPTITAIRNAGATGQIWIEGNNNYGPSVGVNQTMFLSLTDPLNNLIYSTHMYADAGHSGSSNVISVTEGVTELTPLTNWGRSHGLKVCLGEHGVRAAFGANSGAAQAAELQELANVLAFMQANADVWSEMTYWAGGPIWNNFGYALSIEPTGGTYPNAGINDQPPMATIRPYF